METLIERTRAGRMPKGPLGDVFHEDLEKSGYFTVKPIIKRVKIQSQDDAFYLFMKNWDSFSFPSVQEYKALIINAHQNAQYEVSFQEHRTVNIAAAQQFINKIKDLGKDLFAIVAQNHPYKPFEVDNTILETSKLFRLCAEEKKVCVINHLVVSNFGYYSLPGFEQFMEPVSGSPCVK